MPKVLRHGGQCSKDTLVLPSGTRVVLSRVRNTRYIGRTGVVKHCFKSFSPPEVLIEIALEPDGERYRALVPNVDPITADPIKAGRELGPDLRMPIGCDGEFIEPLLERRLAYLEQVARDVANLLQGVSGIAEPDADLTPEQKGAVAKAEQLLDGALRVIGVRDYFGLESLDLKCLALENLSVISKGEMR